MEFRGGQDSDLNEVVVKVKRCAKVMKGGKRFSFSALVVAGDKRGHVGIGQGKAKEVPFAIEKGLKEARRTLVEVPLKDTTIPHTVHSKYRSTIVMLKPACKGTGIIAGAAVRAVLEMAGVRDVLTKVFGSTNPTNAVKATLEGLRSMRSKIQVEKQRGTRIV